VAPEPLPTLGRTIPFLDDADDVHIAARLDEGFVIQFARSEPSQTRSRRR